MIVTSNVAAAAEAGVDSRPPSTSFGFDRIRQLLPHREPFILVDRVLALEPKRRIVCLKNVTSSEPIFASHFPTQAIFPGVLLLEAMAQTTLLLFLGDPAAAAPSATDRSIHVLAGAHVRWHRPVRPGDRLVITAEVEKQMTAGALVNCEVTVDGRPVSRARLTVGRTTLEE